jgi:hypothetical protein
VVIVHRTYDINIDPRLATMLSGELTQDSLVPVESLRGETISSLLR